MKEKTQIHAMLQTLATMRKKILAAELALTELAIIDDKDHAMRVALDVGASTAEMQVEMFGARRKRKRGERTKASFYSSSKLRKTRAALGMNQSQFAAHCGVSPSQICDYEKGKRTPVLRNQRKLGDVIENVLKGKQVPKTQGELNV